MSISHCDITVCSCSLSLVTIPRDLFCAGRVPEEDLKRTMQACGGAIQTSVQSMTDDVLGMCEIFEEEQIGGERWESCTCVVVNVAVIFVEGVEGEGVSGKDSHTGEMSWATLKMATHCIKCQHVTVTRALLVKEKFYFQGMKKKKKKNTLNHRISNLQIWIQEWYYLQNQKSMLKGCSIENNFHSSVFPFGGEKYQEFPFRKHCVYIFIVWFRLQYLLLIFAVVLHSCSFVMPTK